MDKTEKIPTIDEENYVQAGPETTQYDIRRVYIGDY